MGSSILSDREEFFIQEIINRIKPMIEKAKYEAIEQALLMLPEVNERLIFRKAMDRKATLKFFEENKDFTGNMKFVQELIEKTELENPGLDYEKVLELATPEIKKKLLAFKTLDFKTATKPTNLTFKGDHGAI